MPRYIGKEMSRVDGVAKVTGRAKYAAEFRAPNLAYGFIVLGSVAHKPWRSPEAEAALAGRPPSEESFRRAAEAALAGAKPLAHNAYKVELGKRAVVRALMRASRLA